LQKFICDRTLKRKRVGVTVFSFKIIFLTIFVRELFGDL